MKADYNFVIKPFLLFIFALHEYSDNLQKYLMLYKRIGKKGAKQLKKAREI
jgi:hypothetical protein